MPGPAACPTGLFARQARAALSTRAAAPQQRSAPRAVHATNRVTAVGFEPTPLRTGALSQRLRPLGQTVSVAVSADAAAALQVFVRVLVRGWCTSLLLGGRVIAPGFSLLGGGNAVASRRPRTNAANPSRPCANDGATRLANRCCRAAPQAGTTASKRTGRPTVETTSCSATRAEARSCTADASRKPGAANTPHPVGPATGLRAAR